MLYYDLLVHTNETANNNFNFIFYGNGALANTLLSFKNVHRIASHNKFQLIWNLRRNIIKNEIDLVHSHTPYGLVYVFLATLFLPVKRVLTVHGSGNTLRAKVIFMISFILSHRVLFVSFAFKKRMKHSLGLNEFKKFRVLYNGVNIQKFPIRLNAPSGKNNCLFGMVGNFYNRVRDQMTVCKASKILNQKGLLFNLEFVGGAKENNTFFLDTCTEYVDSNNLTECVSFLGFRDDVDKIINNWSLFLYSSNRDTFGIAVIEAMIKGIPVLVNDLDVFMEISDNGKYATLFRSKEPEDLATKIEDYLENPVPYQEKAQRAANYCREKFSIEKHITELQKIYRELKHA